MGLDMKNKNKFHRILLVILVGSCNARDGKLGGLGRTKILKLILIVLRSGNVGTCKLSQIWFK
jgi:hypothetical protein